MLLNNKLQIDHPNNIFNRFWRIWDYVKLKNAMASRASPRTPLGKLTALLPNPLADIRNILFEIITEMLRKKQFWTCNANWYNFQLHKRIIYGCNCIMHGMLFQGKN